MVNYAVIESGKVANIVVADADTATANGWIDATGGKIGDSWDGSSFASPSASAPTAADVKAEAGRRIVAICPEWRQRNLTAQASILAEKGRDNWSAAEIAAWNAGSAIWASITAIRAASDVIEAMDPIPGNFETLSAWGE